MAIELDCFDARKAGPLAMTASKITDVGISPILRAQKERRSNSPLERQTVAVVVVNFLVPP